MFYSFTVLNTNEVFSSDVVDSVRLPACACVRVHYDCHLAATTTDVGIGESQKDCSTSHLTERVIEYFFNGYACHYASGLPCACGEIRLYGTPVLRRRQSVIIFSLLAAPVCGPSIVHYELHLSQSARSL